VLRRWLEHLREHWQLRHDGDAEARRWIVVDTETTGLDPDRDPMLSIGAVAVCDGRICLGDSFELLVQSDAPPDPANVIVHGIGRTARESATPVAEAMRQWRAWRAGAPAVGFHAEFDRRVLRAAILRANLEPDRRPWLDLAHLAPALCQGASPSLRSLDDWLEHLQIPMHERHSAGADALATAQLLLRLLPLAARQQLQTLPQLRSLSRRWLARQQQLGGGA